MIGSVFCQWYSFKDHIYHVVPLCTFRGSFAVSTDFPQHFVSAAEDSFVRSRFPAIPVLRSTQRESETSEFHLPLLRPSAFLCGGVKQPKTNLWRRQLFFHGEPLFSRPLTRPGAPSSFASPSEASNISLKYIPPPRIVCHFRPFSETAAPPLISLNSPAVGMTPGLVFCGDICGGGVSFALWMALKAGFTAPAVRPQHLGLSRLAVKWSAGPPG